MWLWHLSCQSADFVSHGNHANGVDVLSSRPTFCLEVLRTLRKANRFGDRRALAAYCRPYSHGNHANKVGILYKRRNVGGGCRCRYAPSHESQQNAAFNASCTRAKQHQTLVAWDNRRSSVVELAEVNSLGTPSAAGLSAGTESGAADTVKYFENIYHSCTRTVFSSKQTYTCLFLG